MADVLYRQGCRDSDELTALLSVTTATLETYLRDAKRDEKAEQQAKAWDLWLECYSVVDPFAGGGELGVGRRGKKNAVPQGDTILTPTLAALGLTKRESAREATWSRSWNVAPLARVTA